MIRAVATLALVQTSILARADPLPEVCSDPDRPCAGFRANDLSFDRTAHDGKPGAEERSAPFFAVILRSAPKCAMGEAERRAAQAFFPRKKVFVMRFECDDDLENNVFYTGVASEQSFMAVYAGKFRSAAEETLAVAKLAGFADANIRRMQVVFVHP